ncbi:MAG TPA: methyltransferase [Methylomirabilota bacterium]|nr:methyltransferase [Methylomirabilota bacterium]
MRLVLMRHADAGDADPARWPGDRERPLTDAGRREHARVAAALHRMGVVFDRILTSPLARARETADITSRAYGGVPEPESSELLGDRAEPARTLAGLAAVEAQRLLCVGHEPTLSRLAGLLISRDGSARVEMRKSGIAVIDCPGSVGSGHGTLQLHLRPGELVALADGQPAGDAPPSPDLFLGTLTAYQRSAALRGALDLDLFTAIGAGRETAATVAERCRASVRGTRILCDYLTVAGLLAKDGDRYALTADSAAFLDRGSPSCVASAADFIYAPEIRAAFADVALAVRRGGTALPEAGTVAPAHPVWVRFARAMAPLMRGAARAVVETVEVDAARPLRVLDVAAGHGMFGIAFATRYPRAEVTGLDWPGVLEVARENARAASVEGRYRTIPGSAFEAELGGPYDLVLIPNFLHHFDPPTCERFLTRTRAALAPGGRAVTVELVPDEGRLSPPPAAMFALVMLCSTPAGDAYTFAELDSMFRRAGFASSVLRVPAPGGPQVIISER